MNVDGFSAEGSNLDGAQHYQLISIDDAMGAEGSGVVSLPEGEDFLRAEFTRSGPDLIFETPNGKAFIVPDYFMQAAPPALITASGARLGGDLVTSLAGPALPGQVAQLAIDGIDTGTSAQGGANLGAPIGHVSELEGSVSATRADGTQVSLVSGDSIYQGDVIETGTGASVGVLFVDDTIFTLDEDGRMVMDEMVYDPGTQTGSFNAQVVQGVFSFVSGQVAKTSPDAMSIATPTSTIGIRGSTVVIKVVGESGESQVMLVADVDGNVGEISVFNDFGSQVLSQPGASTVVNSFNAAPSQQIVMSQQEFQQTFGKAFTTLTKVVSVKAQQDAQRATDQAQQKDAEAQDAANAAQKAQADAEAAKADAEAKAAAAAQAAAEAEAQGDAEALAAAQQQAAEAEAAAEAAAQAEAAAAAAEQAAQAKAAEAQAAQEQAQQALQFQAQAQTVFTQQTQAFQTFEQQNPGNTTAGTAGEAGTADTKTQNGNEGNNGSNDGGNNGDNADGPITIVMTVDPVTGELTGDIIITVTEETFDEFTQSLIQTITTIQTDDTTNQNNTDNTTTTNGVPTADPVNVSGNEDTTISGQVVATDPDNDTLTYTVGAGPTNGSVTLNADGSFDYTPTANFVGDDSFEVTVEDGQGATATTTVSVTVNGVNDVPVAGTNTVTVSEDTPVNGQVSATDADAGDTLTYTLANGPGNGTVTVSNDGSYTYTPATNYTGADSFTVTVDDGQGGTTTATVDLTVVGVNDAPVAGTNSVSGNEDTTISGQVAATDPEGGVLTYAVTMGPANGTLTLNSNTGAYDYIPNANYAGTDSFDVEITDDQGATTITTVSVAVAAVNDAPVTSNVTASGNEDTTISGQITASDVDAGDTLTYTVDTGPTNGILTLNSSTGAYDYIPSADFNGTDTFVVIVTDGQNATATATVSITVAPVNDAPVAGTNTVAGSEDVVINGQVNATDVDAGDTLTYALATGPANGTVTVNADGTYTYTPTAEYSGSDSFDVTVTDSQNATTTATVNIALAAVNDVPTVTMSAQHMAFPKQQDWSTYDIKDIAVTDFDGDTDDDIVFSHWDGTQYKMALATNDGSGAFTVTDLGFLPPGQHFELGDLNNDGQEDIVFAQAGAAVSPVYFSNGDGTFTQTTQQFNMSSAYEIKLADMNGDGLLDIVAANTINGSTPNRIIFNNDAGVAGQFADSGQSLANNDTKSVAVGDINNDGNIDAVFGNWNNVFEVQLNDGTGTMANSQNVSIAGATLGVELGDLDGDGDLDAFLANRYVGNLVMLNDGTGTFADSGQVLGVPSHEHTDVKLADLDGDGDLDAVVSNYNTYDQIWINDGNANFTEAGLNLGTGIGNAVEVGDFNGDGKIDFVLGMINGANSGVYLNESTLANESLLQGGSFVFTAQHLTASDVDNVVTDLTYTVTTIPTNGALQLNGTAMTVGQTFTQADVDAGNLAYVHGGSATATDSFDFTIGDGAATSGAYTFKLSISDTQTVTAAETLNITTDLTVSKMINDGTVNFASAANTVTTPSTFTNNATFNMTNGIYTPTTFNNASGATVNIAADSTNTKLQTTGGMTNDGTINVDYTTAGGGTVYVGANTGVAFTNNGTINFNNTGVDYTGYLWGALNNTGTITIADGLSSVQIENLNHSGTINVGSGNTLLVSYNQTPTFAAGSIIQGNGTLKTATGDGSATIVNSILNPGTDGTVGTLTLSSWDALNSRGINFTSSTVLNIDVGGTTAGTYDVLNNSSGNTPSLAGTLNLKSINGYTATAGDAFQFMTQGLNGQNGAFNTVTHDFGAGWNVLLDYGENYVTAYATTTGGAVTVNGGTNATFLNTLTFNGASTDYTFGFADANTLTATDTVGNDGAVTVTSIENLTFSDATYTVAASTLTGDAANNTITFDAGATSITVDGGAGTDQLVLADAANTVTVANMENVTGGTGADSITISDAVGTTVNAGGGNNTIVGGGGNDTIVGGGGTDTITGGAGADSITLNVASSETVVFTATTDGATATNSLAGRDTIYGYTQGTDKIGISGTLATALDDVGAADGIFTWTTGAADFTGTHEAMYVADTTNDFASQMTQSGVVTLLANLMNTAGVTSAVGDDGLVAYSANGLNTGKGGGIFYFQENGTTLNNVTADELTYIATIDSTDLNSTLTSDVQII